MKKYLIVFVSVFLFVVIVNSMYEKAYKAQPSVSGKASRLVCHKNTTSFERGFGDELIKIGQNQLRSGNFTFTSYIEKAIHAPSKLFNYVKLSEIDDITKIELDSYILNDNPSDENLKISYYIYENDVGDPGKKTKKSKLYAGYVVYKFYNKNNKMIYQSQIDFMNKQGQDIGQSVKCAIKSFATFKSIVTL